MCSSHALASQYKASSCSNLPPPPPKKSPKPTLSKKNNQQKKKKNPNPKLKQFLTLLARFLQTSKNVHRESESWQTVHAHVHGDYRPKTC